MANTEKLFSVYVLTDAGNQRIYIGQTSNLEQRLVEHNTRTKRYTSSRGPWKVLFQETYPTRHEAIMRERQLKSSRGRYYIRELLRSSVG